MSSRPKRRCARWNRSSRCRRWRRPTSKLAPSRAIACGAEMASTIPAQLDSLPPWARELSEKYYSGVTSMFVLHGNVRDTVASRTPNGVEFLPLQRFLKEALFGRRDLVLFY